MKEILHQQLSQALQTLHYPAVEILLEKPKVATHGDVTTNIAMVLAKSVGKKPREIAETIIQELKIAQTIISSIEIAGPGFINFTFADSFIVESSKKVLIEGKNYGKNSSGKNIKVNIEWVSANPTGPLHSGHGRQVILGAVLANILEWNGYDVTREYYFNNAGNQMRNLAESIYARYCELCGENIQFPGDGYHGEYIKTIAQEIFNEKGKRITDKNYFQKKGEEWCFANIKNILTKLNVVHDVFYNEDSLYKNGKIQEVIEKFRSLDLIYEKDGATWLKATTLGLENDRVIVKNTGEPTYRLPDIAYHCEKFLRGFDVMIDIFGADHIATIPDVLAGVKALGYDTTKVKVIIHQMVSFLRDGKQVKLSKRSGDAYTLDELIEDVGKDAVYYFFVMRSANTHLEFNIDLAQQQSEQNPVYYLQYAHARIASILRFAEEQNFESKNFSAILHATNFSRIHEKEEIELLKLLLDFPEEIQKCSISYEPHHLTVYLREVAETFHKFYHAHRVLSEDKELMKARLALCIMAKIVIANGCIILGVEPKEKM